VSLHQFAPFFYPGTGGLHELGIEQGHGYTLNVPFPPGVGDIGYETVLRQVIRPKVAHFNPDLILVSAGFDAHWRDPLAHAQLTLAGYNRLVQTLLDWAADFCDGRIVFVSEGGYDHEVLALGLLNITFALLQQDKLRDPLGHLDDEQEDISLLLRSLRHTHLL
jgi:acetoin utilization deacetylase AcuC-like enzyme